MHELSIAQRIIEIAEEFALKNGATKIRSIELEIGAISGVLEDALRFGLEVSAPGTVLENSVINIHLTEAKANCLQCHTTFQMTDIFSACPACSGIKYDIIQGKEMQVKAIVIEG